MLRWVRRRPEEPTEAAAAQTAYSHGTWGFLVTRADGPDGRGATIDAIRRLVASIERADRTASQLSRRIAKLTVWLLMFTIVISALTVALLLAERQVWPFVPETLVLEGI